MFQMGRLKELKKVAQNPSDSEYVDALVSILVELEHRQLEQVEKLHAALGINGIEYDGDRESRKEHLLDLADAVASGSFTEWWFDEVVAEHVENVDDARAYAGLSDEDWQEQIEAWADTWRDRTGDELDGMDDRAIARMHVDRKFGVVLESFEQEVVAFSRRDALRTVLAGNFEAVEQGIKAATAAVDDDPSTDEGEN